MGRVWASPDTMRLHIFFVFCGQPFAPDTMQSSLFGDQLQPRASVCALYPRLSACFRSFGEIIQKGVGVVGLVLSKNY